MGQRFTTLVLCVLVALSVAGDAEGHESRPLYLEITEQADGQYTLTWRVPPTVPVHNFPRIAVDDVCQATSAIRPIGAGMFQSRWTCQNGIGNAHVTITYPAGNPSVSSLLRINWLSGEVSTVLADPGKGGIAILDPETSSGVARQYLTLGAEHILSGYDHLLFLLCLIFVARTGRRIAIAVTGFTVAHSLTLALAALRVIDVSIPAVEVAIALSIVFLATEIARKSRETLTWRFPIAVSGSFGLLHGLGFASVLSDIGLPQTEVPIALLFFNLGVEVGQLLFVGSVLALALVSSWIVKNLGERAVRLQTHRRQLETVSSYAIGILATWWMVERMAGVWA